MLVLCVSLDTDSCVQGGSMHGCHLSIQLAKERRKARNSGLGKFQKFFKKKTGLSIISKLG